MKTSAPKLPLGLLPLLLLVATAAAYLNSFRGVFLFDDTKNIVKNEAIRDFGANWARILTSQRSTVNLTLALNHAISGVEPWSYHSLNLCAHIAAGLVLFDLVRRTLLLPRLAGRFSDQSADCVAFAAALLWLLHPLQTQAVTYVIQRAESLMGLFYLLTMYCVLRGSGATDSAAAPKPKVGIRWYVAAVIACLLGMGCKPVMATAPIVVFLYDSIFLAERPTTAIRRRGGLYAALAATWLIYAVNGVFRSVFMQERSANITVGFAVKDVSWIEYALTQPGVILYYLRLAIWPHPLCLDYVWPIAETPLRIIPPLIGIIALLALTAWAARRHPPVGFLGIAFFLILAPTSSVIPIKDLLFEHRMYLALAPLSVLAVLGGRWICRRLVRYPSSAAFLGGIVLTTIAVAYGLLTLVRNKDYSSNLRMWEDVVAKSPLNPRGHNNLTRVLIELDHIDDAIAHCSQALAIDADFSAAHNNLAVALMKRKRIDEAIHHLNELIRLRPNKADPHGLLAVAYQQQGKFDEAKREANRALEIDPNNSWAYYNLGNFAFEQKEIQKAIDNYRESLRIDPAFSQGHHGLAMALMADNRVDEAIERYREAIRLDDEAPPEWYYSLGIAYCKAQCWKDAVPPLREAVQKLPNNADWHYHLGVALGQAGDHPQSEESLQNALRLSPDHEKAAKALTMLREHRSAADARGPTPAVDKSTLAAAQEHVSRAESLRAKGLLPEAIEALRAALLLLPNAPKLHNNLANLLMQTGSAEAAVEHYDKAIRLDHKYTTAYVNLGGALAGLGRNEEALQKLEAALKLDPGNILAHKNLALLLNRIGRPQDAVAHFEAVLKVDPADRDAAAGLAALRERAPTVTTTQPQELP